MHEFHYLVWWNFLSGLCQVLGPNHKPHVENWEVAQNRAVKVTKFHGR